MNALPKDERTNGHRDEMMHIKTELPFEIQSRSYHFPQDFTSELIMISLRLILVFYALSSAISAVSGAPVADAAVADAAVADAAVADTDSSGDGRTSQDTRLPIRKIVKRQTNQKVFIYFDNISYLSAFWATGPIGVKCRPSVCTL